MQPTQYLKASDGTGNASVATIQNVRASGATTNIVDTIQGMPEKFYGSMGTPHTFIDPVTSEEITIISEATAVDFAGHIDGSNIEIDEIAPGYTDNGSEVGDIIIIRPTTPWADTVADAIEDINSAFSEQHNSDGSHSDVVAESLEVSGAVTLPNNSIDANELATSAITLGYAEITANAAVTATTMTAIAGLSVPVTIPAGGRRVKITCWLQTTSAAGTNIYLDIGLFDGATEISRSTTYYPGSNITHSVVTMAVKSPAAGAKTYSVSAFTGASQNVTISASATRPAFILVEAI